jgi:uncharacterized protein YqeY
MATLQERIETDYKTALKAGERLRVDALRLIKADLQRVAIERRAATLDDAAVVQVIAQQAKQRRETMEAAKRTTREDVLRQTTAELAILSAYLPQPLSEEALRRLIDEAVAAVGAKQGPVMQYVMSKAAGAVDGQQASRLVSERLRQQPA